MASKLTASKTNLIHVLFVDDEENQTELAVINLENSFMKVTATTKPSEALKLLADQSFDCIVSDYQMPEMTGIQLCTEVRKKSSIPFIIYTGRGSEEIASTAFAAGVDDYVKKEETLAHYQILAKRIRQVVDKKRTEEALRESESILHSFFDSPGIMSGIVEVVDDNTIRHIIESELTAKFLGITSEEMRYKLSSELGEPSEVIRVWVNNFERSKSTGKPVTFEYSDNRGDHEAWLSATVNYLGENSNGYSRYAYVILDETERKKAENENQLLTASIKKENEKLSALVNSIHDEIWFTDMEKKFTLANSSALKEFGLNPADSGIDVEKLAMSLEVYRLDGSPRPVEESPALRALRGEVVIRQEEIVKTPASGELRYRAVTSTPVNDANGNIIGSVSVVRDITDRKKAEEALRESEERYRMIFNMGQIGIAFSDLQGCLLLTNPALQKMLGYTESELQNKNFREFTLDIDLPEEKRYITELIDGKRDGYNIEKRFIRKDGEIIWAEIAASILRDSEGKPIFGVVMVHDVNDRKNFEEALSESNKKVQDYANKLEGLVEERTAELHRSEERFRNTALYTRALIEASLDPLVTISKEGKITDVNEATIKITGVFRQELIGSDFSDYFTKPEDAKAGYLKVFEEGEVKNYPLAIKSVTGEVTDVLYNAILYKNELGVVQGVFAAARDITERKKAEEKLLEASHYTRSLIEASLDPLVTISPDGKITDVNEATINVTGITREELIGSDFSDYFTNPEAAKAGYRKVFEDGYVKDYALTIQHKSGKLTDVNYNATVFRDQAGEIVGIFAAARDVTEKNQLLEKLHRSEVIAAVEQMGATVAHDLRGPLGLIVQSVNTVKQNPSLTPRMLQLIEENAVRSLKMIADWRASTREMVPQPVKTNMGDLIKSVIEGLSIPNNIDTVSSIGEGLSSIKIDPNIMHRVLDNLVKNAVEAMPIGGKLSINAERKTKDVVISVSDTGTGIPLESKARIFSPLYTTKTGGMGLGLTYCRRAVEAMGGSIDFESKVHEGTTFTVKLPFIE